MLYKKNLHIMPRMLVYCDLVKHDMESFHTISSYLASFLGWDGIVNLSVRRSALGER